MKGIAKTTLHTIELTTCALLMVATGNVFVIAAAAIPTLVSASKLIDDIKGNKINDSIFTVYRNGKIFQNSTAHPLKMLSISRDNDKTKRFTEEALTMFTQLKNKNNKGKEITYTTKSQPMTLFLLRNLQKNGYIKNLESKRAEKKRLIVEKLFMGNLKDIGKKTQMYKISFNLTDKERNKEDLINIFKKNKQEENTDIKQQEIIKVEKREEYNVNRTRSELVAMHDYLAKQKELINQQQEIEERIINPHIHR